jgi:hypothetical protein
MMRYLARTNRIAIFVTCLLLLAYFAPSVALACEGAGEEVKGALTLKPQEWGEGARGLAEDCPLKPSTAIVVFGKVGKWCEYELRNGSAGEEVTIERVEIFDETPPGCESEREVCAGIIRPLGTQCLRGNRLRAPGTCFISVEYKREPTRRPQQTKLLIEWKGRGLPEVFSPKQQFE